MKKLVLYSFFVVITLLMACNPDDTREGCVTSECRNWSFAIVDAETNENLVGRTEKPFHPDSIDIFYKANGERIFFKRRFRDFADWWEFSFNYHDELMRCDLHKTDSTFLITYYFYLNQSDTDTLDIRIAPCRDFDAMFYNSVLIEDTPAGGLSSFFLRKQP